jgi:hypothetical protein
VDDFIPNDKTFVPKNLTLDMVFLLGDVNLRFHGCGLVFSTSTTFIFIFSKPLTIARLFSLCVLVVTRSIVIARSSWAFEGSLATYIVAYIHITGA